MYKCSTIEKNISSRNHTKVKEAHFNTEANVKRATPRPRWVAPPGNATFNRHYRYIHRCKKKKRKEKKKKFSHLSSRSQVTFSAGNTTRISKFTQMNK